MHEVKNGEKKLSERKKQILRAVVEAHIATGEPVGSKYLTDNAGINFSSATVRSEMADLEARISFLYRLADERLQALGDGDNRAEQHAEGKDRRA